MSRTFRQVSARIRQMERALATAVGEALEQAAQGAAQDARARAPVDSGALRQGIEIRPLSNGAQAVVSTAPHAAMVELGTRRMAARPYLLPAAEAARATLYAAARACAVRAVEEVWK